MVLYRSEYLEGGLWNGCSLCFEGSRVIDDFCFFFFDVVRIFFKEDVKDVKIYYLYYKVFLFLI